MRALVPVLMLLAILSSLAANAQSKVGVELADVTDNRISEGMLRGGLELRLKLTGDNLDRAAAARILIKDAKDDLGTQLAESKSTPDFSSMEYSGNGVQVSVAQPPRKAKSVRVKGTIELYVPSRDPAATITIDKPLSKLDKPLASTKLKSAKITLTPLSAANYAASQEKRKVTPEKIEELRAKAKAEGVSEKEIEFMAGLAEAMNAMDEPLPEGAVALAGVKRDFDRIFRVDFLGADGKPVSMTARSTTTRGDEDTIMTLQPSEPLPANAPMRVSILTDKARVSFPFDLNVTLP